MGAEPRSRSQVVERWHRGARRVPWPNVLDQMVGHGHCIRIPPVAAICVPRHHLIPEAQEVEAGRHVLFAGTAVERDVGRSPPRCSCSRESGEVHDLRVRGVDSDRDVRPALHETHQPAEGLLLDGQPGRQFVDVEIEIGRTGVDLPLGQQLQVGHRVIAGRTIGHRGPNRDGDVLQSSGGVLLRLLVPFGDGSRRATPSTSSKPSHSSSPSAATCRPTAQQHAGRVDVLADDRETRGIGHGRSVLMVDGGGGGGHGQAAGSGLNWQPSTNSSKKSGVVSSSTCSIARTSALEPRARRGARGAAGGPRAARRCRPSRCGRRAPAARKPMSIALRDVDVGREAAGEVERGRPRPGRRRARAAGSHWPTVLAALAWASAERVGARERDARRGDDVDRRARGRRRRPSASCGPSRRELREQVDQAGAAESDRRRRRRSSRREACRRAPAAATRSRPPRPACRR